MVGFTSVLFASLAALSSVSAVPTPASVDTVAKRFDAKELTAMADDVFHEYLLTPPRGDTTPEVERAIFKRSSVHSGSATYTAEGLVSHAIAFLIPFNFNSNTTVLLNVGRLRKGVQGH